MRDKGTDWRIKSKPQAKHYTKVQKGMFTFITRNGFEWRVPSASLFWEELARHCVDKEMWFSSECMPTFIREGFVRARAEAD